MPVNPFSIVALASLRTTARDSLDLRPYRQRARPQMERTLRQNIGSPSHFQGVYFFAADGSRELRWRA